MNRRLLLLGGALVAGLGVALVPAQAAQAHPLGNFSVNQSVGLVLRPDRVEASLVVDAAEIPTLQDRSVVDTDASGTASEAERLSHARRLCATVANAVAVRVDGSRLMWTVLDSSFGYEPGSGGLMTSRLT